MILSSMGYNLCLHFFTGFQSFDQKGTGRFKLDVFISLCIFVQSAR